MERSKTQKRTKKSTKKKTIKRAARKPVVKKKTTRKPVAKTAKAVKPAAKKRGRPRNAEGSDNVETAEKKAPRSKTASRDAIEQIMFRLPNVPNPLEGTPKEVQDELDGIVLKMQKNPEDDAIFNRIHLYIHGYLVNTVLKKFPYIKGLQTVDVYQETLIALRFKAIPNFKKGKGMSFLNFAKMCIRRHLITLLNASKNRKKDQSINQAISLDSSPVRDDPEDKTTFANIITDENSVSADVELSNDEAFRVTKTTLMDSLSDFERMVLAEFLSSSSYREISRSISKHMSKRCNTKSVDNALLRIRTKAAQIRKHAKPDELPIFISR